MRKNNLFEILDQDQDGAVSRAELHEMADKLNWDWSEAQLFAFFDLLSVTKPIPQKEFEFCLNLMAMDPYGPYGQVLLRSPAPCGAKIRMTEKTPSQELCPLLHRICNAEVSDQYQAILGKHPPIETDSQESALFIIDPQRAFIEGTWKQSIGKDADLEVMPIELAFHNCACLLQQLNNRVETMFSRCPFPPKSYPWAEKMMRVLNEKQVYFIKPGNSILWPPTNGFAQWIKSLNKKNLVLGGCTLNSCVRVSAIEVQTKLNQQVIVDLSLCGGRRSNYIQSPEFNGFSSVEAAIKEMTGAGVFVTSEVRFS